MSKKSRFSGSFNKWHGKPTQTLLTSELQHLYHIYWSLWRHFSSKKCLLIIFKILGLLFKPLTADDKYSLLNRGNLLQHFQSNYLRNKKYFLNFSLHFLNWNWILKFFSKEMTLRADVFLNWRTLNNAVRWKSKKSRFRGPFGNWHGKWAKTLLKFGRQHHSHIHWSLWRQFRLKKSLWVICKILRHSL